ncbi:MAG: hypothetical protein ACKVIH_01340 [Burkholderiales bacterium]
MNAALSLMADTPGDFAHGPGRSCPLAYRYNPSVFARPPEWHADTLYVVGGLYGNPFALDAIEALFARESGSKHMVFNGDFHWFDIDPALFASIDARVHQHTALRGNVETELANADSGAGCGCAYPSHVADADVARSNTILQRLRETAHQCPAQRVALGVLPMHSVAQVGAARIAVVHGDAESLAGWQFDPSALDQPANRAWLDRIFDQAQVDVFASSHTCTPGLRQWKGANHSIRAVINNGSAGMGHAAGHTHGTITRISLHDAPSGVAVLNETRLLGVYIQAIQVDFDDARWQQQFLAQWPPGSAAHMSYWSRITGSMANCTAAV